MHDNVEVDTVSRAFRIIRALRETGPAGTSELAATLELPVSTVNDHIQTLRSRSYVVKRGDAYTLGTRFLFVGDRVRRQMRIFRSAKEELDALADETAEHASLTIEEDGIGVIIEDVRGQKALEFNTYPGMRTKLHLSAAGKAILATLPDARVREIIDDRGLTPMTDNTITGRSALFDELEHIREVGYALDMGESIEGMRGVGVPLHDRDDSVLGGISLYGPRSRMSDDRLRGELPTKLQEAANVIEVEYQYKGGGGS